MGLKFRLTALGAACAAAPAPAHADVYPPQIAARDATVKLEPASPWNIDFAQNSCRLTRLFGTSDEPHLLIIDQSAPTDIFGLTLAGREVRHFRRARSIGLGLERDEPGEDEERPILMAGVDLDEVGRLIGSL